MFNKYFFEEVWRRIERCIKCGKNIDSISLHSHTLDELSKGIIKYDETILDSNGKRKEVVHKLYGYSVVKDNTIPIGEAFIKTSDK